MRGRPDVLGAAWGWLVQRTRHPRRRVFDAYREVWSDLVWVTELDGLVAAAMLTLRVTRSSTWTLAVAAAGADDRAEWGDAPVSQLRHLLQPWAPGRRPPLRPGPGGSPEVTCRRHLGDAGPRAADQGG